MHQDRVRHYFSSNTRVVSHNSCELTSTASPTHYSVTEQPQKIPYYAALLKILHEPPPPEIASDFPEGVSLGRSLLEDFWKGFQGYLDQLAWREIRLCVSSFLSVIIIPLNNPGPIDPILRASHHSKYHLTPVYDFVASIVHGRAGRVRRFSGKGQACCLVCCRGTANGAPTLIPSNCTPSNPSFP